MATPLREQLIALTEPLLGQLGYELVDLEYAPGRTHAVVRVFIDKPQGVGLDDCEQVSHELSALFDVEDPVPTAYTLEVSSPGLDRVLRTRAHFQRFVGARVWVELRAARDGRRRYTGKLESLDAESVELVVDGAMVRVPFDEISRARLAPQWSGELQEL
ncbi:MAG TPA: ribosome maturation factor RimP [Steroidobacteraceae bacterium]|jgi:ribosome maturation factor RimP|nr:ribosome maturation factor RimP [Steroidobacteraceae bacterium]